MGFNRIYPLANVYITMENHHVSWVNRNYFNSYFDWAMASIAMSQSLPEGNSVGEIHCNPAPFDDWWLT